MCSVDGLTPPIFLLGRSYRFGRVTVFAVLLFADYALGYLLAIRGLLAVITIESASVVAAARTPGRAMRLQQQ